MAKEYSGQYMAALKAHAQDGVKQYFAYDVASRMEYVYTAYTEAPNGAPCMVTQYTYVDASSNRVQKMKEYMGVWSVAYDV